ncbi:MAG: hypothetical protein AB7U63_19390, partial [Porticoccaceae bacterium]
LLHEYETRLLKDKLLEFPGLIRRKKDELSQARRQLSEAQNARAEIEALLVSMIAAEVNPNTGKPAFSNAEARAAELINRKKQSAEYQQAEKVYRDSEVQVNSLQFDLERLQDEFRAYRYVVDLTARELALIASDQQGGENSNGINENKQPY